jgi:hypothetical protein
MAAWNPNQLGAGGLPGSQVPVPYYNYDANGPSIETRTNGPVNIETKNVQGKLLTAEMNVSLTNPELPPIEYIKKQLCTLLVDELYNSGMVQFMKQQDPRTGTEVFRGYVFVTDKEDVMVIKRLLK